jgi:hypothetical protein
MTESKKQFIVTFAHAPYRGAAEKITTILKDGPNVIDNREDALVLLRWPGMARFVALDAVEAGLVSLAELKGLGYAVPEVVPVAPVKPVIPVESKRMPNFDGMSRAERQSWAEKMGTVIPARAGSDRVVEILEKAWKDQNGGAK